ncbi:MAG: hypothetical protein GY713_17680 [Actinomycetia bacterium]|nr:hypothetical protein [Actinomycetes bacterium]
MLVLALCLAMGTATATAQLDYGIAPAELCGLVGSSSTEVVEDYLCRDTITGDAVEVWATEAEAIEGFADFVSNRDLGDVRVIDMVQGVGVGDESLMVRWDGQGSLDGQSGVFVAFRRGRFVGGVADPFQGPGGVATESEALGRAAAMDQRIASWLGISVGSASETDPVGATPTTQAASLGTQPPTTVPTESDDGLLKTQNLLVAGGLGAALVAAKLALGAKAGAAAAAGAPVNPAAGSPPTPDLAPHEPGAPSSSAPPSPQADPAAGSGQHWWND